MEKIELTKEDAELFKFFTRYYDIFKILILNEIAEFKNGSFIIHKDENGKIRKIEKHIISFKN